MKSHLFRHGFVLGQNAALKNPEALFHIAADFQIHAGFVVFQSVAAAENAAERHVERRLEVEGEIGPDGEAVEIAHPLRIHPAGHVAREGGVGVAVGADDRAGADQRQDVALGAVGKIGGMDQAESGGSEHLLLLAAARGFVHQRGRIPLAESDGEAARAEPLAQQRNLRALARAVDSLDDNELASMTVGGEQGIHQPEVRLPLL